MLGDSRITIDWVNGKFLLQVVQLQPLMRQIRSFLSKLEWYSFNHICRELNVLADELSKEALSLEKGAFIYQEFFEDQLCEEMSFLL